MTFGFRWEPAAISEALRQVLFALAILGVIQLDETQTLAIVMAVSAFLSLFTRQSVVTQQTLEAAGTTQARVVAQAEANQGREP